MCSWQLPVESAFDQIKMAHASTMASFIYVWEQNMNNVIHNLKQSLHDLNVMYY